MPFMSASTLNRRRAALQLQGAEPVVEEFQISKGHLPARTAVESLLYQVFGHFRMPNAYQGISVETVAVVVDPAFRINSI